MKNHKYADLFPMIDGAAFDALIADIREHGQRETITLFDGQILDGRNRWKACVAAGLKPDTTTFHGTEAEALALVISSNLHRRHLDESQRAMVGARIANMNEGRPRKDTASIEAVSPAVSQTAAAEQVNASRASVQRAAVVIRDAEPELVAAVDQGHIPVSVAEKLSKVAPDEQRAIVARVEAGAKLGGGLRLSFSPWEPTDA